MTISQTYRKSPIQLTNYNYYDIAEGTGTIIYYGTMLKIDSNFEFSLLNFIVESAQTRGRSTGTGEISSGEEVNFDLSCFNLPKTIRGTAYISLIMTADTSEDGGFEAQIKKWDGINETNISSKIFSGNIGIPDEATQAYLIKLPLTKTNFKKGEILRVTIKNRSPSGEGVILVRPTTNPLKVFIPFDLNL